MEGLEDVEGALARRVAGLREYADEVEKAPSLRESAWSGTAAEAARALADAHIGHTMSLADSAQRALTGLREYRAGAEALRARAQELDSTALGHGMSIAEDGSTSSASGSLQGLYTRSVAQKIAAQASALLARSRALDQTFAQVLAGANRTEEHGAGASGRIGKRTSEQLRPPAVQVLQQPPAVQVLQQPPAVQVLQQPLAANGFVAGAGA